MRIQLKRKKRKIARVKNVKHHLHQHDEIHDSSDHRQLTNSTSTESSEHEENAGQATVEAVKLGEGQFMQCHLCNKKYRSKEKLDSHLLNHPVVKVGTRAVL